MGALSLDNILRYKYLNKKDLEKKLNFKFRKFNFFINLSPPYSEYKQLKKSNKHNIKSFR